MNASQNHVAAHMPLALGVCLTLAGVTRAGYTVSGYVYAGDTGLVVPTAKVTLTLYLASGPISQTVYTEGVGIGEDTGYYSAGWSGSSNHIGKTMKLHASKGQGEGGMCHCITWTCSANSETKNITIKVTIQVNEDLVAQTGAAVIGSDGPQPANAGVAFVVPGGDPVEADSYSMSVSFDPGYFSCIDVQPVPPFDSFFDSVIDNASGTMHIQGSAVPGTFPPLGDDLNPTHLFDLYWEVQPFIAPDTTTVSIDECQMVTPTGEVAAVPSTTEYFLGEIPPFRGAESPHGPVSFSVNGPVDPQYDGLPVPGTPLFRWPWNWPTTPVGSGPFPLVRMGPAPNSVGLPTIRPGDINDYWSGMAWAWEGEIFQSEPDHDPAGPPAGTNNQILQAWALGLDGGWYAQVNAYTFGEDFFNGDEDPQGGMPVWPEEWEGRHMAGGFIEPTVAGGGLPVLFYFSVDPWATGLPGTAVENEATLQGALALPPGPPGSADVGAGPGPWQSDGEAAGDVFRAAPITMPDANFLDHDDATMALLAPRPGAGADAEDDLDALEHVGTNTLFDGTPGEPGNTHDRVDPTAGRWLGTHPPDIADPSNSNHDPNNGNPIIFSVDRGSYGYMSSAVEAQQIAANEGASGDLFIAVSVPWPPGPAPTTPTNMLLIDEGQLGLMPYDDLDAVILKLLIDRGDLEARIEQAAGNFNEFGASTGFGFTIPLLDQGEAVVGFSVDASSIGQLFSAVDFECRVDGMGLVGPGYAGSGVMEQAGDIFYSDLIAPPGSAADSGTGRPLGQNYLWFEERDIGLDPGAWTFMAGGPSGDLADVPDELNALDSLEQRPEPPGPPPYPHNRTMNRYISFDPNKAGNDGLNVAFQVELKSLGLGSCNSSGEPCRIDKMRCEGVVPEVLCQTDADCVGLGGTDRCISPDCGACSVSGNACLIDLYCPPGETCDDTGEICVNDHAGSVGATWWVGPPKGHCEGSGAACSYGGPPCGRCSDNASLGCTVDADCDAGVCNPSGETCTVIHLMVSQANRQVSNDWPPVVLVGDCEIVPRATYGVRAVDVGSGLESDELTVSTIPRPIGSGSYWADGVGTKGDLCTGNWAACPNGNTDCPPGETCLDQWGPPDGYTNFDDVTAAVFAFQKAPGLTLPHVMWVDMHGNDAGNAVVDPPNYVTNFADIQQIVLGFAGWPYLYSDPADCPDVSTWPSR